MSSMNIKSAVAWMSLSRVMAQVISWATTLYVMRFLTSVEYGTLAIATSYWVVLGLLLEFSFGVYLVRSEAFQDEELAKVSGLALVFAFLGTLSFIGLGWVLSVVRHEPTLFWVCLVLSGHYIFTALNLVPDAKLQRSLKFRTRSIVDLGLMIQSSLGGILLVYYGFGIAALVLPTFSNTFFRYLITSRLMGGQPTPTFSWAELKELTGKYKFCVGVTVSRVIERFANQVDTYVATIFLATASIGLYSVAVYWAMVPLGRVMNLFNQIAFPILAEMRREGKSVAEMVIPGLRLCGLIGIGIYGGLASVAPEFMPLVVGDKWIESGLLLQAIALAMPFRLVSSYLVSFLLVEGRVRADLKNNVVAIATMVIGCFAAAPFGVRYLAYAVSLCVVISSAYIIRSSFKALGVKERVIYMAWVRQIISAGLGIACARLLIPAQGSLLLDVLGKGAAFSLVYAVLTVILCKSDWLLLVSYFRKSK
jgi:teichuronic acid exporter